MLRVCSMKIQSPISRQTCVDRLIQPGDADYDEARKVYNGMIHKKPRLIARCADVADVIRSVNFATRKRSASRDPWWRPQRRRSRNLRRRFGDRSRADQIHAGRSCSSHRHSRRRMHLGRCRSCHACVRTRHSERNHFHDWRWWINPGRRSRTSHPQMRIDHR